MLARRLVDRMFCLSAISLLAVHASGGVIPDDDSNANGDSVGCDSEFSDGFDVNDPAFSQLLDAIMEQETGGEDDPNNAVGDGGDSLGAFQIQEAYWQDAVEQDPSLAENGQTYDSVTDESYARDVVAAYMSRYATEERLGRTPTAEDIARMHQGGPNGFDSTTDASNSYASDICDRLESDACCDPHFHMWDRKGFSYHGECDLVLVHVPKFKSGSALNVHLRTEIRSHYSVIINFAIGIGTEVFEVAGKGEYYLNGIHQEQPPSVFAGFPIKKLNETERCVRLDRCPQTVMYKIDLGFYGDIVVTVWKDIVWTSISASKLGFRGAVGLSGKWGTSGMFARDDTLLKDANEFGREWQVRDTEPKLFHRERAPQYPVTCKQPPKMESRRYQMDPVFYKKAEDACSHKSEDSVEMCLFDVLATGDLEIAYVPLR